MARAATTVKILPETHAKLQEIAKEDDRTLGEVINDLVERHERERFRESVIEDLREFREDKEAYAKYMEDFAEWDAMVNHALAEEPPYYRAQ